ncbi:acetoin utilization protein AcuC [Macrococcoides goetzii]|uniref:Acetoin utilization protein AcuC n=1 Tax=Macrococcoides goetzii TaxID=1891097 RepID=A0A2G5NNY6_9STAP|nr:acetoin utilization protein AcuC [Macrococcus goetzii]RAI82191.1 acetoin utilization protein AcuC [Macrococcus goetzii]
MTLFVYDDALLAYRFSNDHPFNQMRLLLTKTLLEALQLLPQDKIITPRIATDDELLLGHQPEYIQAVKDAGQNTLSAADCEKFGLNSNDTPNFESMHEKCATLVGATLTAVDAVMTGQTKTACNFGGGLHHGFRGRASGFCIYNDSTVAIEYMRKKYNKRVLYIDTDAHHGDGVQFSFYNDNDVFTYSIHETGRYLFPGTGTIHEKGDGNGYLYSMNLPVDAYTEDDSFLHVFRESLIKACEFFKPDIILSQNGADAHYLDPLTHLSVTHRTFQTIPQIVHQCAAQYTDSKWIAIGGGGYNIFQVAPLAWAQVYNAMLGNPPLTGEIPKSWIDKWQQKSKIKMPHTWNEDLKNYEAIPRRLDIEEKNQQTLQRILMHY